MAAIKNDSVLPQTHSFVLVVLLLILGSLAGGCAPQPTPDQSEPPTLLPSPSATTSPAPVHTPTLELLENGLVYAVAGITHEQSLTLYQEPSDLAGISGQIPPTGRSIRTTGVEHEANGVLWLEVEYQGMRGWVDQTYLARQQGELPEELVVLGQIVTTALKAGDYSQLQDLIHPQLCLRFAPYSYLGEDNLVFCPEELANLSKSNTLQTWGQYDGTGLPIELSLDVYHQYFVYDQDYFHPKVVGFNHEVSSGNAINNLANVFPDGMMVEYHFPGFDPQYAGMDWRSLRLVFLEEGGVWYLVALVHGEWTI